MDGWSEDELLDLIGQFGNTAARDAARTAATQAGTTAAAQTGVNAAGSMFSAMSPLSAMWSLHNILKTVTNNDAQRAQYEAEYRAALEELQRAGFDPNQTYSPEAMQGYFDAAPELAGIPGFDAATFSQQAIGDVVSGYQNDPSRYSTVTGANQLASTPNPVDYGRDVLEGASDIWNDPSTLIGIILGPGGITGNVEWGGGTIDNAPGTSPAVYTGKIGDKVYTGASTGIPVVDAAIRRVLGQTEGGETSTWDVVTAAVEQATGYPASTVSDILEDVFTDSGPALPSPGPTSPTGGTPSTTQPQDQTGGVTVGADGDLVEKVLQILRGDKSDAQIRAEAEAAGVSPEDIAKVAGMPQEEVQERWENAGGAQGQPVDRSVDTSRVVLNSPTPMPAHTPAPMTFPNEPPPEEVVDVLNPPVEPPPEDVVDVLNPPVEQPPVPPEVVEPPATVLPEEPPSDPIVDIFPEDPTDPIDVLIPPDSDSGGADPGQGGTPVDTDPNDGIIDTPGTPGTSGNPLAALAALGLLGGGGGARGVNVKPGELVDINYVFDMGGRSAIPDYLRKQYASPYGMSYYSAGGSVPQMTVDELLAILRG